MLQDPDQDGQHLAIFREYPSRFCVDIRNECNNLQSLFFYFNAHLWWHEDFQKYAYSISDMDYHILIFLVHQSSEQVQRILHLFKTIVKHCFLYLINNLIAIPSYFHEASHYIHDILTTFRIKPGVEYFDKQLKYGSTQNILQIRWVHG